MSNDTIQYVLTKEDVLHEVVDSAKSAGYRFYIGVAREFGKAPLEAMRNREIGGHHADKAVAKDYHGVSLSQVNYTPFLPESEVCGLEQLLIAKYLNDELCQNKKHGQDTCITTSQGIVYVRIYSAQDSSVAGDGKKTSGVAKGAKKQSK